MSRIDYSLCVAPMLDWTDKHCRFFHRLLAPKAHLYTEMVTTGAILHGDTARHLDFNRQEHTVALQLGGSEPQDLAECAKIATQWGYDEINLNCGCPSERVQKGAFGACLMREPELVADSYRAMSEATNLPVTVKHRIGIDYDETPDLVFKFVDTLYAAGCRVFIVHARNAVLKGLSPKDNRRIPSLRYDVVHQLKQAFPEALMVVNGGIETVEQIQSFYTHPTPLDGVMIGRHAYHEPRSLMQFSQYFWSESAVISDQHLLQTMHDYLQQLVEQGGSIRYVLRHMLGLFNGQHGARRWRQMLSDSTLLAKNDPDLLFQAWQVVLVEQARQQISIIDN